MKKTLLKGLALAAVGSLLTVAQASALTFTETLDGLLNWSELSETWGSATTVTDDRPFGQTVDFVTTFDRTNVLTAVTTTIGITGSFDLTGFDAFAMNFLNHNENPWNYSLWMTDGTNTASVAFTLADGSATSALLDISSLSLANITSYGFTAGGFIPNGDSLNPGTTGYPDWSIETKLSPVPEPATMLLFGTGLAGLAGVRRRKGE